MSRNNCTKYHHERLPGHHHHHDFSDNDETINDGKAAVAIKKNEKLIFSSIVLLLSMGIFYTFSLSNSLNHEDTEFIQPSITSLFDNDEQQQQITVTVTKGDEDSASYLISNIDPNVENIKKSSNGKKNDTTPFPSNLPWPLPYRFSRGFDTICLNAHLFQFIMDDSGACSRKMGEDSTFEPLPCLDLFEAFDRYKSLLFDHTTPPLSSSSNCISFASVLVENGDSTLDLNVDESFTLMVPSSKKIFRSEGKVERIVKIKASTAYGAMRALESLSQLVQFNFTTKSFIIKNTPWIIHDKPQYSHRELLIDTSRHFLPLSVIRRVISSLSYAKINVLHWHLVDDQSFPFCSEVYPEFCVRSGYSSYEHYTKEDIMDIVSFARKHAVRIVMEVDIPGHTSSWCKAIKDICTANGNILSPANSKTKQVVSDILREIAGLVPDTLFHLGGDEVDTTLWDEDGKTVTYMKHHNISSSKDIYLDFVRFAHETILSVGKVPVGWGEIWSNFGDSLDKRSIMQKWLGNSQNLTDMIHHGYRVINVDSSRNYLDHLDTTWEEMYSFELCSGNEEKTSTTSLCEELVIGGGGEMWGETVDASDLLSTVWPKLGAIAERLWSPKNNTDLMKKDDDTMQKMIKPRLCAFRCLLDRRGIAATPLNKHSREAPKGPDSCYRQ